MLVVGWFTLSWSDCVTRITSLLVASMCSASMGAFAADQILTFTGLGPVRIGMTVPQAEEALGAKFEPMDTEIESENCWTTRRADHVDPLVTYMIWKTKIVRIDVDNGEPGKDEFVVPPVVTPEGIRVGATEQVVKQTYGARLRISPHHYMEDDGHYMEIFAKDRRYGLLFESTYGKVVGLRAGRKDAIRLVEGCL